MISATHRQIRKIVIVQCGLFGMLGIIVGVITGWLVTYYFSKIDGGHIFSAVKEQLLIILSVSIFTFILSLLLGINEAKKVSSSQKSNIQME
jgi:ABC-type antimicrobial peptide transport system permease subunit